MKTTRINKKIADAGITSRRKADKLIEEGRVVVNGKKVTEPGLQVTDKDQVTVDGVLDRVPPSVRERGPHCRDRTGLFPILNGLLHQ